MVQITGGQLVARTLKQAGVTTIFTLCGVHIIDIYNGCLDEGIRIIDVRHEQTAAHAAEAWTRLTGIPGVAVVTAGPGVTDAVTGIANAFRNQTPMLRIGGQAPRSQLLKGGLQELDHVSLMKPITKISTSFLNTERIPEFITSALREAYNGRPGPAFLEIPMDVLDTAVDKNDVIFPAYCRSEGRLHGDPALIEQAAALLEPCGASGNTRGHPGLALPRRRRALILRRKNPHPYLPQWSRTGMPFRRLSYVHDPVAKTCTFPG